MIDLSPRNLEIVKRVLRDHVPGCEVRAFGSRATWTAKDYSDLDLALVGDSELGDDTLARLREAFDESNLPFRVDLFVWDDVPKDFRRRIEAEHVVLAGKERPVCREWPTVTLGECIEMNDAAYASKENWPFVNYLDTGNVTDNRIGEIQHLVAGKDEIPSRARRKVQTGDIVYSTVRPNQRHFGLLKEVPENFLASTGFAVIRGKKDCAHTDFLYWFLAQSSVVDHLHTIAEHSTSAYPSIRPADIGRLTLGLPPLSEQRAIAGILSTLDDKIELNRRMNKTLEAMARALFKSWFVRFDPLRAQIRPSGARVQEEIIRLFPRREIESAIGAIPDGWKVKTLGDLCDKPQYGYTASAQDSSGSPKFLRITDINKAAWIDWRSVPSCRIDKRDYGKYRLRKGDVLIARMADPGHGVLVEEDREAVFASYLIRFRPTNELYGHYIQYWLRSEKYWSLVSERGVGTTRKSLNAKALCEFPLLVPPAAVAEAFAARVLALRNRIVSNVLETNGLSAVRNTLLPKLLSGEIRIQDAEKLAEAAT